MKRFLVIVLLSLLFPCTSCQRRANRYYGERPATTVYRQRTLKENTQTNKSRNRSTTQQRTTSNRVLSGPEIFKMYSPAVFMIYTSSGYQDFQGSGFFVSSDGVAVSNYHVFKGTSIGAELILLSDKTELKIEKVIVKDDKNDLIVFKVDSRRNNFTFIPISKRSVQVGQKAYAISSPLGLENTFSSGEVSQLRGKNVIQINIPIDHGSSGGALINEYGEVFGVTSGGIDESIANLNYAISLDPIRQYISR